MNCSCRQNWFPQGWKKSIKITLSCRQLTELVIEQQWTQLETDHWEGRAIIFHYNIETQNTSSYTKKSNTRWTHQTELISANHFFCRLGVPRLCRDRYTERDVVNGNAKYGKHLGTSALPRWYSSPEKCPLPSEYPPLTMTLASGLQMVDQRSAAIPSRGN